MGIRFDCVQCGHTLHVKDYLAGKRGICPHCQGKIDIPLHSQVVSLGDDIGVSAVELRSAIDDESTREIDVRGPLETGANASSTSATRPITADEAWLMASANAGVPQEQAAATPTSVAMPTSRPTADAIGEAPQLQWYVLPPGSITKYGPAQGEMMRTWVSEGRVAAEALVWREGWPQWRVASTVFPHLVQSAPAMPAAVTVAAPRPTVAAQDEAQPISSAAPTMVLGVDEPVAPTKRAASRPPPARRMREQRSLLIGLLVTLVVILLPLLLYVLWNQ